MAEKTKKIKWTKPVSKNSKSNKILKKLYLFILVMAIVVFALIYILDGYNAKTKDIYTLVGNSIPMNIGSKNSLYIREYAIVPFVSYLKAGNFEEAYNMCSNYYKDFFTLEDFKQYYGNIDVSSIEMKEVKAKTDYCYEATMVYYLKGQEKTSQIENTSGETLVISNKPNETKYLLYPNEFNTEIITISPDNFLYGFHEAKFKKDRLELDVEKCLVYTNHIDLNATIKNTSLFSDITINSFGVGYDNELVRLLKLENTLKKGDSIPANITIEGTDYLMPNNIQIERIKNEKTLRTYTFYFEESK